MKNIIIALVVLAMVGIGTYYFVFSKNAASPTTSPHPSEQATSPSLSTPSTTPVQQGPNTASTTSLPARVAVSIKNFAFNPASMSIKAGTKVTWTNNDSVSHTVTSDSGTLFDSSTLAPGQSFSFTFGSSGTYSYHCSIHPMMKGTVVVTN